MTDRLGPIRWSLQRGEPFMDGKSRYLLRRSGIPGVRGTLTLTPEEADDIELRLRALDPADPGYEALVERLTHDINVVGMALQMGQGALPEPIARNRREALVRAVLAALRKELT